MDTLGRRDPQGYYIVVIPKSKAKFLEEFKNDVEIVEVGNDEFLIRSKSRGILLKILKRLS
ncbi:MAG: hypothetical protein QXH99_02360 [Sulfolobales archaeon]